jgi:hypothetical protein
LQNPAKCISGATEVTILGYTVSAEGASAHGRENRGDKPFPTPYRGQRQQTFLASLIFTGGSNHKPPAFKRHFTQH